MLILYALHGLRGQQQPDPPTFRSLLKQGNLFFHQSQPHDRIEQNLRFLHSEAQIICAQFEQFHLGA